MKAWLDGWRIDIRSCCVRIFRRPRRCWLFSAKAGASRRSCKKPEQQNLRYGRHASACDFLLHDLEHAHKFFGDEILHRGQVRFFRALQNGSAAFAPWTADPIFKKDLDYLKSDMNSHPVHLMKYLKAVVLSAEIRRTGERYPDLLEDFWRSVFVQWKMDQQTLTAALRLNQPALEQPKEPGPAQSVFHREPRNRLRESDGRS